MEATENYTNIADRFGAVADEFCAAVDAASRIDRVELLARIYRILPKLINEAIKLPNITSDDDSDKAVESKLRPNVRLNDEQWGQLYKSLKQKLGDWDGYTQVFDPTTDKEASFGTLADDIADIYRDLKEGLVLNETSQATPEEIIWDWRFAYYSHWGKHAIDALLTIHFRLQGFLE
jgi:hypothetical protein